MKRILVAMNNMTSAPSEGWVPFGPCWKPLAWPQVVVDQLIIYTTLKLPLPSDLIEIACVESY